MKKPVFIGGLSRSGKTYMRFMLASHPDFAISKRINFWGHFQKRFGDLQDDGNLDRCMDALFAHKHIGSLNVDLNRIRTDFETGARTYERLFDLIHEYYARQQSKSRWGTQSELLEKHAAEILTAYPDAKFIHMIRDPRDRHEAVLWKSSRKGGVGATTALWLSSASLAQKNAKAFPDRYKVVRYEDMVTYPKETMYEISKFLGVSYDPKMLKMSAEARFADLKGNVTTPLTTDYVGRFRKHLPAHETAFIQQLSRHYMRVFNYPLESTHFSPLKRLYVFTVHWLVNAAYLFGWRVRNLVTR